MVVVLWVEFGGVLGLAKNSENPSFRPMLVGFSPQPMIGTYYKVYMFWVGGWGQRFGAVVVLISCGCGSVGGFWCPGIGQK